MDKRTHPMTTLAWLLRREFWENKGAFFWAPAVVALVMLVFVAGTMAYGTFTNGIGGVVVIDGHTVSKAGQLAALPLAQRAEIAGVVANTYLGAAAPLFGVLPLVVFFYCLSALYDERRDRSILFWKSLPVSDAMTVFSKVLAALCLAPLITITIGTAVALAMLFIGLAAVAVSGLNLIGLVLAEPAFYLAPLRLVGMLPVYMLWALPTVGWLLLVSSWARSKVLVWAVGVPLLLLLLSKWASFLLSQYLNSNVDVYQVVSKVVTRCLGSLVPGAWLAFGNATGVRMDSSGTQVFDAGQLFTQSWMTLLQADVWVGVAAGAAMIFAAVRLRRWRDEL